MTVPHSPVLAVTDLTKRYRVRSAGKGLFGIAHVHALDGVSLHVAPREIVGVVGESGCGKSTLARCLLGLETPTSGGVTIAGDDAVAADRRMRALLKRRIQMVFQDPYSSLNPRWTTEEVLAEPLRNIGVANRRQRRDRAAAMLEKVGLKADDLTKYPFQFSGGQRQRIGIARALLMEPEIVIGDEPVSALDMSVQAQILNLLLDLHEETGLAVVLISHDLELVERMCGRVYVMYLGRVVETGPAEQLFSAPHHPYTAALQASVLAKNPRHRKRREIIAGEPPNPSDLPKGCRFQTRCPLVQPVCRAVDPVLRTVAPGRMSACHFGPVAHDDAAGVPRP